MKDVLYHFFRRIGFSMAVAVPILVAGGAAHANLITNGSFETYTGPLAYSGQLGGLQAGSTTLPGWAVTTGSVDFVKSPFWLPANGVASLDMNGGSPGGIAQSFATELGAVYKLAFMLAANYGAPGGGVAQVLLHVAAGDAASNFSFNALGHSPTNMGWTAKELLFTATAATTTLSFTSLTPSHMGPALDAVRVEKIADAPVPEPAAAALIGGALLGLAGLRRKRRT